MELLMRQQKFNYRFHLFIFTAIYVFNIYIFLFLNKNVIVVLIRYEPFQEKTNSVVSAYSIGLDKPKHVAKAYPDRHFSPHGYFLFQESLRYTSIPFGRNVSACISLRGLSRLIQVDKLRRVQNRGLLAERLFNWNGYIYIYHKSHGY